MLYEVITLQVVTAWHRSSGRAERPGLFVPGIQQAVVGQRHDGALLQLGVLEGHAHALQPLEVGDGVFDIAIDFIRIGIRAEHRVV